MMELTAAQENLVLDNMRLVHYIAQKYKHLLTASNSYSYDDLVSEGNIALIKAAKSFDETKDVKFTTFAARYLSGAMLTFINKEVPLTKVARSIIDPMQKAIKLRLTEASAEELAKALDISLGRAKEVKSYLKNRESSSLDAPILDGDGKVVTLMDTVQSSVEIDFDKNIIFHEILLILDEREKAIALMRLNGLKQSEIAKSLGISQVQVSRVIKLMETKIKNKVLNDQRGGQTEMSKIGELMKKLPKETLRQQLLEDKTSAEIAKEYGVASSDIDSLKYKYHLTKTALQSEIVRGKEMSENIAIEVGEAQLSPAPMMEATEIKSSIITDTGQTGVNTKQTTASAEQMAEMMKHILAQLTKVNGSVVNVQNVTINIEVCS